MTTASTSVVAAVLLIASAILGVILLICGVLNLILVHAVPGMFYLILSMLYVPVTDTFTKQQLGFVVPVVAKVVIGLVVLWGTLAVGDLAEIMGL